MRKKRTRIPKFKGQTFVAWTDICGFKGFMREGVEKARDVLDHFYNSVYCIMECRGNEYPDVVGILLSDGYISWVNAKHGDSGEQNASSLKNLLKFLAEVHQTTFQRDSEIDPRNAPRYLVKSTVAFGEHLYDPSRKTVVGKLEKHFAVSPAFVEAYLLNEIHTDCFRYGGGILIKKTAEINEVVERIKQGSDLSPLRSRRREPGQDFWEYLWPFRPGASGGLQGFEDEREKIYKEHRRSSEDKLAEVERNYAEKLWKLIEERINSQE